MDKRGEVNNRWYRVFEKSNATDQQQALSKISAHEIINDVRYLRDEIKRLEEQLSAALNPFSSSIGQAVLWQDGGLCYMLNGTYIPVKDIHAGLELLKELYRNLINPRKVQKEIVDNITIKEPDYENNEEKRKADKAT